MAQKAIALGSVAGAISVASAYAYTKMSTCLDRNPFIEQGLTQASLPVESVGFWKVAQVDNVNNISHATVSIGEKTARITARRIVSVPESSKSSADGLNETAYDDLDAEGSGLAFYWENPWEIKASIVRGFKSGVQIAKSYIPTLSSMSELTNDEQPEADKWEIVSVSLDNQALIGDLTSHPFFASQSLANLPKSEKTHTKTKYFLGALTGTAVFLVGKRTYVNYRMWPAYTFARDYIQRHPLVTDFYGGETAEIVTRTGSFGREKIEAEITITGKKMITESVVKFSAGRKDMKSPWMISQALLVPNGCKPIDLLVSRPVVA